MNRDEATLLDIEQAARLTTQFVEHCDDEDAFRQDAMVQSAVLHQLMILGEATKRLSDEVRAAHPQIPWRTMAGMRDVLIHGYDAVDLGEVWRVARRDIPALIEQLEPLLPDTPE
jgi:uncharacterized protein with HEPN domain